MSVIKVKKAVKLFLPDRLSLKGTFLLRVINKYRLETLQSVSLYKFVSFGRYVWGMTSVDAVFLEVLFSKKNYPLVMFLIINSFC